MCGLLNIKFSQCPATGTCNQDDIFKQLKKITIIFNTILN